MALTTKNNVRTETVSNDVTISSVN